MGVGRLDPPPPRLAPPKKNGPLDQGPLCQDQDGYWQGLRHADENGGNGDQAAAKPGFFSEGNPYQKTKTQRIWPTIFLKMGGLSPALSKMGGRVPPPRPPLWRSPWLLVRSHRPGNDL